MKVNRNMKVRRIRARRENRLRRARTYAEDFVEYAFRNEQDGTKLKNAPFHIEWQQAARENAKLVLFAPVEHAKTQHLGIGKPLHLLGQDPNRTIAIISNTENQAKKSLKSIRQHIAENPLVKEVFPDLKPSERPGDPWSDAQITVERTLIRKDPSVQAVGMDTGRIVGSRLDVIILDDVLDRENTNTEEQRKKMLELFETQIYTRLNPGGTILVIGTPWHQDDLMHVLAQRPGFHVKRYSAVENPDDPPNSWMPVWKEQWPLERLLDRYQNTTERVFLRKYLCRVRVDSAGRFRAMWIERMVRLGKGRTFTQLPPKAQGGEKYLPCFTGCDLGVGKKDSNAQTSIFTAAIDERGRRIIVNIEAGRWTAPEIIERLYRAYLSYDSIVHVENNAAQDFLVQIAQQRFPVKGVHTGRNKYHEEYGVEGLAVQIRNGWWIMPSGSVGTVDGVPDEGRSLINEMLHFDPEEHTGDRLMSMWIASEAARMFGMPRTRHAGMQNR